MLLAMAWPAVLQARDRSFDPAEYDAKLIEEHFERAPGHELTVQRIVSAEPDEDERYMVVWSYTLVLDCKRPEVISTTRCDPCEYPMHEWVRRPMDIWFIEKTWPREGGLERSKALRRIDHFNNYFMIRAMEGREHAGVIHQFWRFDGRRPSPLKVWHPPPPEPPPGIDAEPPKEWDEIAEIEILYGDSQPEHIVTPVGERSISLEARAYTRSDDGRRLTEDFWPFWSSDCGSFSNKSGEQARRTIFRLNDGVETCSLYLYEARTGERRKIEVELGQEPPPPVRVAITFEGGREADGVVLSGTAGWIDIEVHAYNPEGEEILGFEPEWSAEGATVEFLDDDKTRLRVRVNEGVEKALIRARDTDSDAEDTFEIKIAD